MKWLVCGKIGLFYDVLAIGISRNVRNQFLVISLAISKHNNLRRNSDAAQIYVGIFFLGEIDGCCRLPAVDDLHTLKPQNTRRTISGAIQLGGIGYNNDAIVVGHETIRIVTQTVPNPLVYTSAANPQKRTDICFENARPVL